MEVVYEFSNVRRDYRVIVKGIKRSSFQKERDSFLLLIDSYELNLRIKISYLDYYELNRKHFLIIHNDFVIRKKEEAYEVRILIPLYKVKNMERSSIYIKYSNEQKRAEGLLFLPKEKLLKKYQNFKTHNPIRGHRYTNKKERKKIKETKDRERYKRMAESIDRIFNKKEVHAERPKNEKEDKLTRKGIRYIGSKEKRSCNHCIYLKGNRCVYHEIIVQEGHSCVRFKPFHVTYGGGFSPK